MNEQVYFSLQKIAAAGGGINLLNVYQGVSLSFPASLLEVGPDYVRVETNRYQAVCMYVEKRTFLQSNELPEILRADVIQLEARSRSVTLAHFRPVESTIGKRMQVRVAPKDLIDSSLKNPEGRGQLRADLADISQDGLGIYLARELFAPQYIYRDAQMVVNMRLPGIYEEGLVGPNSSSSDLLTDRFLQENVRFSPIGRQSGGRGKTGSLSRKLENPEIQIHGTVINTILQPGHNRYRIGMRILAMDASRPLISQFIARRQSEIIREITTLYGLLVEKEN